MGSPIRGWTSRRQSLDNRKESAMLWTILIILVIIAVAFFVFGRVRGGRGV